jgi:hypothetical protein
MFEPNTNDGTKLLEQIAALEHNQWTEWSKNLAEKEHLSEERLERWQKLWVPYEELNEKEKEADRVWARRVLAVTGLVVQEQFEKWARNLERRLGVKNSLRNHSC